jgi:hypothetical protein
MKHMLYKHHQQKEWQMNYNSDFQNPMAFNNFMHALSYHRTPTVLKEMYENVRTLFYELAVEDNLRMGFIKGITLALSNLEIRCETEHQMEERSTNLLTTLLKVVLLPTLPFYELAHDHPNLYAKPSANDILDTRLIKAFIKQCVPTLEDLYFEFQNNMNLERSA